MEQEIMDFAQLMQTEINNNSPKGNWRDWTHDTSKAITELQLHYIKLTTALRSNDIDLLREYIADTACSLMYLAHNKQIIKTNNL